MELTLLRAVQIQQYRPILNLVHKLKDDNIPLIYYHRKCRGIFTVKKDLDRICKAAESKSCNPESLSIPGGEIKSRGGGGVLPRILNPNPI